MFEWDITVAGSTIHRMHIDIHGTSGFTASLLACFTASELPNQSQARWIASIGRLHVHAFTHSRIHALTFTLSLGGSTLLAPSPMNFFPPRQN